MEHIYQEPQFGKEHCWVYKIGEQTNDQDQFFE